jgi:hypothetical protein
MSPTRDADYCGPQVSLQNDYGPNRILGTIQLYTSMK